MHTWQTKASIEDLTARASILHKIRNFFVARNILEVETPLVASTTNPDPNVESFMIFGEPQLYLQTSPEFYMKKLLASYSNDIFQICKAFRKEELGSNHQQEFTMLEWYRVGMDYHELMDEVYELICLFVELPKQKITYRELFIENLGIDPFIVTADECKHIAEQNKLNVHEPDLLDIDPWLDLLLSQIIEPNMPKGAVFVYDYKPSQAALAKIRNGKIAERFELYINGIEIANGFAELTESNEQLIRFKQDNLKRKQQRLPQIDIDDDFISSLDHLPECSGVAIGVDRLVKICLGKSAIQQVMTFSE